MQGWTWVDAECQDQGRAHQREELRRKRLLSRTAWYRPADVVGFIVTEDRQDIAAKVANNG